MIYHTVSYTAHKSTKHQEPGTKHQQMITIDRTSNVPVHEQLVEQLRFLIASGQFKIDEILPSTRALGRQTGVSFHTVRKAYQQLEQEGLLEARVGSGFRVKERVPLGKSERIERGASIVQDALQKLIGLGLQESEVEYLFNEQLEMLTGQRQGHKLIFAARSRELASLCAEQIAMGLQQAIEPIVLDDLGLHQDADYVLTRFAEVRRVMEVLPRADVLGVVVFLGLEAMEQVARLLPHQTLGLVTRYSDAIPPLTAELKAQTGFKGQAIATSLEAGTGPLRPVIEQADLLVYTPPCRRRLLPLLLPDRKHVAVAPVVSRDSLERLRQVVPG